MIDACQVNWYASLIDTMEGIPMVVHLTWGEAFAHYLSDVGAVVERDHYGEQYVSIATYGPNEAVQISKCGKYIFVVELLSWDRTGGVSAEREVYVGQDSVKAVEEARKVFRETNAFWERLEAQMSGDS